MKTLAPSATANITRGSTANHLTQNFSLRVCLPEFLLPNIIASFQQKNERQAKGQEKAQLEDRK